MRLFDLVGRWLGRVEVVFAGADDTLRAGEEALAANDPMRARAMARRVLERLPGSLLGLALLSDACQAAGLEAELADTLEELARRLPSNADVWVRVGKARQRTSTDSSRDAYLRALSLAEPGSDARRGALLSLAASDLARGDAQRALAWLDRLEGDSSPDVALARAEAWLALGKAPAARAALGTTPDNPTDPRAALTRGRILSATREEAAFSPLLRAYILEAPLASELLSSAVGWIPTDAKTIERVRIAVDARGEAGLARWRAAFARSRGGRDEARAALEDALTGGDTTAARPLLDAAIDDRNDESLTRALAALPDVPDDDLVRDARKLAGVRADLATPHDSPWTKEDFFAQLDALATVSDARLTEWTTETRTRLVSSAVPSNDAPSAWSVILARLDDHARAVHDLEAAAKVADVSAERRRPLRLAIVGEFNAGKSTFINALIGADVAPTGVLPTTATLHHLRYAPDPVARIVFETAHDPPERLLPLENLRATLKQLQNEPIVRVEIGVPLPALTRVEVLDTPGFNAPDPRHTRAARRAFDESDVALWLFDATQPFKQTEREILDEVRDAGIPLQILINKADRLSAPDLERVVKATIDSLAEIRIASWSPPLAFSARLALAAKLGDENAKAPSRWADVEAMFESEIVARAPALKERALRRRAREAVRMLRARAETLAKAESEQATAAADRSHRFAVTAARLEQESAQAAASIAKSLATPVAAWRADLAMVVIGKDSRDVAASASLDRYRADRLLAHVTRPLAFALAGLAEGTGVTPAELAPMARAIARPFSYFRHSIDSDDAVAEPLARAGVATLVDLLMARGASPPTTRAAQGRSLELASFDEALA